MEHWNWFDNADSDFHKAFLIVPVNWYMYICSGLWLAHSLFLSLPLTDIYFPLLFLYLCRLWYGVGVSQSLVVCIVFCWPWFLLLFSFFWSLYCLVFFELLFLITPSFGIVKPFLSYDILIFHTFTNLSDMFSTYMMNFF